MHTIETDLALGTCYRSATQCRRVNDLTMTINEKEF